MTGVLVSRERYGDNDKEEGLVMKAEIGVM